MAKIFPFSPYRYSAKAGPLDANATQPYDKISPEMRTRYLSLSPYNLVRIILGESSEQDTDAQNVYTRASAYLNAWIQEGILVRESEDCLFAYSQEFDLPGTGEHLVRQGFIGLGAVEDYEEGTVHRHERTLSGPKKDRLELLRHTRAHFGQIFMLYPDPERAVDALLDQAMSGTATASVTDEYGVIHSIWKIADRETIALIRNLMADKKLVIADGHHRYETAIAFRNENPGNEAAGKVMMTFVNMYSPGLRILAAHRTVSGLQNFDAAQMLVKAGTDFDVRRIETVATLHDGWNAGIKGLFGVATGADLYEIRAKDPGNRIDLRVLYESLLEPVLGIGPEAIREGKYLGYIRGIDVAMKQATSGEAQAAFLVKPVSVQEVADVSFAGGVMPQKSTDFYPKLLSGFTIYRLDG